MITPASARSRFIPHWLLVCLTLVALMVFIGGVTRLTESGLSIVEWKLVSGILPPLSDAGWEAELDAYRASPQYQQVNTGMSVPEFKQIFWLEWGHRLLGRTVGLVFALPYIYFLIRRRMDGALAWRMALACLLVGAQGTVGWLMVKSGLVNDPRVSPVRLAAHLSLAFAVFGLSLWTFWQVRRGRRQEAMGKSYSPLPLAYCLVRAGAIRIITALLCLQIIFGALVAGLDAGLSYNTWPLMDGDFIPHGLMLLSPWHRNLLENIATVQFQHRMNAYLVAILVISYAAYYWQKTPAAARRWLIILPLTVILQVILGIATLLYNVPIALASIHQMVALLLLSVCLWECFRTLRGLNTD